MSENTLSRITVGGIFCGLGIFIIFCLATGQSASKRAEEDGRKAAKAGIPAIANPYQDYCARYWLDAYMEEMANK